MNATSLLCAFHLCSNPPLNLRGPDCPYNARQYSIVKDLDCLNNRHTLPGLRTVELDFYRLEVVGPGGIEPPTSPLSGVRSSHLSYGPKPAATGGAGRDRTGDLLNANQALSQLSYSPRIPGSQEPAFTRLLTPHFQSRPVGCRDSGNQSLATFETLPELQVERVGRTHRLIRRLAGGLWSGTAAFYSLALYTQTRLLSKTPPTFSLRKEVIQPQVLLRLPCYDFTPIMDHTLGRCPPCGLACRLLVQFTFVM